MYVWQSLISQTGWNYLSLPLCLMWTKVVKHTASFFYKASVIRVQLLKKNKLLKVIFSFSTTCMCVFSGFFLMLSLLLFVCFMFSCLTQSVHIKGIVKCKTLWKWPNWAFHTAYSKKTVAVRRNHYGLTCCSRCG